MHTHTCTHTCHAFSWLSASLTHTHTHSQICRTHSGCCYHASESKHQLADISHGWNIFALTLVRDANCVLRGPSRPHTTNLRCQRVQCCRSQTGREVFQFSEALNEDGCSPGCFSHLAQTVGLSLEHPQESFFFLPFTC